MRFGLVHVSEIVCDIIHMKQDGPREEGLR